MITSVKRDDKKTKASLEWLYIRQLVRALEQANSELESIIRDGFEGTKALNPTLKACKIERNKRLIGNIKKIFNIK